MLYTRCRRLLCIVKSNKLFLYIISYFSPQLKGGFVEAVAAQWRGLSDPERKYWEGMAKKDKKRFSKETKSYTGPIGRKLRTKKNPLAPKRPMSGESFLKY